MLVQDNRCNIQARLLRSEFQVPQRRLATKANLLLRTSPLTSRKSVLRIAAGASVQYYCRVGLCVSVDDIGTQYEFEICTYQSNTHVTNRYK